MQTTIEVLAYRQLLFHLGLKEEIFVFTRDHVVPSETVLNMFSVDTRYIYYEPIKPGPLAPGTLFDEWGIGWRKKANGLYYEPFYFPLREAVAKEMGVDLRGAQPSPGNMAGGLTTIEEKSLGAIAKGGSTLIQEFVGYGERPTARGLVVMDTAGNDPESVTAMVAGGAPIILFTTGRGTPVGNPIAPVIKIASNTPVYKKMADDMDLNAGTVLEGEPLLKVVQRIFEFLLKVANGAFTSAERLGHRELFAIEPRGPRV